ncbi:MerR family transcriptional regulator [Kribbella sp. CA-253562]|uniref:MerR family transcriptional regulator n=1 Tax=Kribbella sp. CA-253562 TaxID=3239942 RepID=UPI003D900452
MTYSIGELSRRTGLTVKTIRFYSDRGVVPSTRSATGHRRYDGQALARLELIRTLRDLGLPLAIVQQVLDGRRSLTEVAATQAEALTIQIRQLRTRRAVLAMAAERDADAGTLDRLHQFARMSELERTALVDQFLTAVFERPDPSLAAARRSMMPELPDEPTDAQIAAWADLVELVRDEQFSDLMRELVDGYAGSGLRANDVAVIRRVVGPAVTAGIDPRSAEADSYVAAVGKVDVDRLALAADARRERYFELLAVVNGWAAPESPAAALGWYLEAVRR